MNDIVREDVTAEMRASYGLERTCVQCGRAITLLYNGGELDMTRCCGYRYALESPTTLYVVTKPLTP